ncbi:unnamed protein product, partial [Mesorhabditis belari]|uniref:RRM domain-containing protein n=1 Tax=Mesorhabditis belari TaxID=2138241 RepID=A0AAF3FPA8_9BILA
MLDAHPLPQIGSWAQLMEDEEPPEPQLEEQGKSKDAKELGGDNVGLPISSLCVCVKNLPPKVSLEEIFLHFGGRDKVERIYFISEDRSCLLALTSDLAKKAARELDESYIFKEQIKVSLAHPKDPETYYKQADPMPSPGLSPNATPFVPRSRLSSRQSFSPTGLQMISPRTECHGFSPSSMGSTCESNQPVQQQHLPPRPHQQDYQRPFTITNSDRQRSTSYQQGSEYGKFSKQRYDGLATSNPHSPALKIPSQSVGPTATVRKPTSVELYGEAKPVDTATKFGEIDDKLRQAARKETQQMPMEEAKPSTTHSIKSKSVLNDSHNDSIGNVDVNMASRSENKMDSVPKQSTQSASPVPFKDYGSVTIHRRRNDPEVTDSPAPIDPVQHPVAPIVEAVAKNESPRTRTFSRTSTHPSRSNSDMFKNHIVKHLGSQIESDRSRKESTKTEETRETCGEALNRGKPPLDKTSSSRGPHGQSNVANRVTGQPYSLKSNQPKPLPHRDGRKDPFKNDHPVENAKKMTADDSKHQNKENNKKKSNKENKQSEQVTKTNSILDKNPFSALQGLENN